MKAKVIETGEIIEVFQDFTQAMWFDKAQPHKSYHPNDLEFLPEESKEVTIEGWVARGANPHHLALYERKPDRLSDIWGFSHSLQLDPTSFPEVTWESEPKRVKITITPIEE
ncbi:MAG: hypothetical protein HDQ88_09820 [Clostridia bacterium]|nr:hypothetical protein [Clostridia bacterium]